MSTFPEQPGYEQAQRLFPTSAHLPLGFVEAATETSPRHPLQRAKLTVAEKPLDFSLDTTPWMQQESY
jgi:hypothetical protein